MQMKVIKTIRELLKDDGGVAAIEYAFIASATGLALAATMPSVQANLSSTYSDILGYFTTMNSG